jgi:hypothetical protein
MSISSESKFGFSFQQVKELHFTHSSFNFANRVAAIHKLCWKDYRFYALYVVHTPQKVLKFTVSISNTCDLHVQLT